MHGRYARYTYTGDAHELARKAEEGIVPILQAQPGFRSYTVSESDGEILSVSAWDTAEEAEAANAPVAEWVAANLADRLDLQELRIGEILFSTLLGVTTKTGAAA